MLLKIVGRPTRGWMDASAEGSVPLAHAGNYEIQRIFSTASVDAGRVEAGGGVEPRIAAVYDDISTRAAVVATAERCGFVVQVLRGPRSRVPAQLRACRPRVVVFDLASGGSRGLHVIDDLRTPGCAIVLLAPFEALRSSALAAGAYELTGKDDLRQLERCLRRLTAELDAGDSVTPGDAVLSGGEAPAPRPRKSTPGRSRDAAASAGSPAMRPEQPLE